MLKPIVQKVQHVIFKTQTCSGTLDSAFVSFFFLTPNWGSFTANAISNQHLVCPILRKNMRSD